MTYKIKEIYYSLQGEGVHTGRPAIFCRFSGCNLWSGREKDRENAICTFCDTQFWGTDGINGGKFEISALIEKVNSLWPEGKGEKFIICTGGEPALQVDQVLVSGLQKAGFRVAIETNGTIEICSGLDWVCVSPKANTELKISSGDELKLVYPQKDLDPTDFDEFLFTHYSLQPMDGPFLEDNTAKAIAYCKANPKWNLSIQMHKIVNIP